MLKTITINGVRYRLSIINYDQSLTRLDGPGTHMVAGIVRKTADVPTDRTALREWVTEQVKLAKERHAAAVQSLRDNGAIK